MLQALLSGILVVNKRITFYSNAFFSIVNAKYLAKRHETKLPEFVIKCRKDEAGHYIDSLAYETTVGLELEGI